MKAPRQRSLIMASSSSLRNAYVPNKDISGMTVVITGAKTGIGLAMVRMLLEKDNVVIVASR